MTKVVFLSWAFPPMRLPRAVQVARMVEHLGRPVEVICGAEMATGGGLVNYVPDDDRVRVSRLRRPAWRRYADALLARTMPAALTTPDPYWDWARGAARHVLDSVQLASGDVLVTFGQPMSDHLAGLRIKRRRQVPWIAQFSDPWTDNPFVDRKGVSALLNRRMERAVIDGADRVLFSSEETAELVMAKYPDEHWSKVRILPHAFDERAYPIRRPDEKSANFVFRHLGNFYGHRTPQPLFDGLKMLCQTQPSALDGIRIELIGSFEKGLAAKLDRTGIPPSLLEMKPSVDYRESLDLMVQANALLVIDAPAKSSVFLPSKLVDYIGSGRPVFAITPPGTSARLVNELGGRVADPSDRKAIAKGLLATVEQARAHDRALSWGCATVRDRFRAATVAAQMGAIIDEMSCGS